MTNKNTIIIVLAVFLFLFLIAKKRKALLVVCNNTSESQIICPKRPDQNSITDVFKFASSSCNEKFCKKKRHVKEYLYETLDEQKRRILKLYINLAISKLNNKCKIYAEKNKVKPFSFTFLEIINASSSLSKKGYLKGHSRWRTDIMVEETTLHLSLRIVLDFTVKIKPFLDENGKNKIMTCAEYTTFPFPKYFIGYPTLDQMIPLPSQVVSTGPGLVLSNSGKQIIDYPEFESLTLNKVWMENSDLALGTALSKKLPSVEPAVNDTNLPRSKYINGQFGQKDINFPEKFYSDCIESTGKAVNTDICDNYTWKPPGYNKTGSPENNSHFTGNSETFKQSMVKNLPSGWIQPAKWRNKWPRLWSEPRDRYEYPSTPVGYMWNNMGVRYPIPEPDSKHPGIRWSTKQTPRTPHYWPTITGLPLNNGPNHWLFNQTRGFQANLPHGGP